MTYQSTKDYLDAFLDADHPMYEGFLTLARHFDSLGFKWETVDIKEKFGWDDLRWYTSAFDENGDYDDEAGSYIIVMIDAFEQLWLKRTRRELGISDDD